MTKQPTYRHSPAKILFALAFLISLSFFPGTGGSTISAHREKTKTEQVFSYKIKTPDRLKSFQKKVNYQTPGKSPALKNYETQLLSAYNRLIKTKFKAISQLYPPINLPDASFRLKTIPQTSKENDFISFAG